ncbi:MAG: Gfo/Idh/MocA family protein [Brooklawnia sp.]|jgi:predicted dehydrogenase
MPEQIRTAVVGVGAQGRMYAQLIADGRAPSLQLAALCSANPNSTNLAAHQATAAGLGVELFTDYAQLLASGSIDAVVITTPHYEHPAMALAAVQAGIHVLLEKPAGIDAKSVGQLFDAADARPEVTLAMMFNQRANPLYADLKALIDSGELGELRRTSWLISHWWRPDAYYTSSPWRASWGGEGGGVLVNQAPHQLDLWTWLCGMPTRCFARIQFGYRRDITVDDEVATLLEFPGGAPGTFNTCTNDLVGTDRLEMGFDRGRIVVDDSARVTVWRYTDAERTIARQISPADAAKVPSGAFDRTIFHNAETREYSSPWGEQHALVLDNFGKHIIDGTPLIAPGRDGLNSVRLANAMYLSAWTGTDIELDSLDDDLFFTELNKRIAAEGRYPQRTGLTS